MKILNFGSINVDIVLSVPHMVRPGETISAAGLNGFPGGKGANQSVALARAGATVLHAGQVGKDTLWMRDTLTEAGVDTRHVLVSDTVPGGQAFIQVEAGAGAQNAIIVYGGANQAIPEALIATALADMERGDWLLLQNEINLTPQLLAAGHERGLSIALNPSPFTEAIVRDWPLELVNLFIVNEIEGAELAGLPHDATPSDILSRLSDAYPQAAICLTLGERGSCYHDRRTGTLRQDAFPTTPVDTTAAGDTFTGFLLAELMRGHTPQQALRTASQAAAIAVSHAGAIASIPTLSQLAQA